MKKDAFHPGIFVFHFISLLIFSFIIPNQILGAPASTNIPLGSWIYPALEKLEGLGLIDSNVSGTLPYTRLEAVRIVEEAAWRISRADNALDASSIARDLIPSTAREILANLETEFAFELNQKMVQTSGYFKPVRDLALDILYLDADSVSQTPLSQNSRTLPNLFPNNNGIDYEEGTNLLLSFESEVRLGSFLLLDVRPLLQTNTSTNDDASVELLSATATLALGPAAISYGKQPLWWGQGRHGTLALTNNTDPTTMLRITNPNPILLPWAFRFLGPFRIDCFWTRLGKNRSIPNPNFMGMRVNFVPIPSLEVGASRTTIFGGDGQPGTDFDDFLSVLPGVDLSDENSADKQLNSLDIRLRFPFLWNATLYGEIAGGGKNPNDFSDADGWIAGVYLPQIEPSGRAALRFEYSDLTQASTNGLFLYSDEDYLSGYTYKGKILGHHADSPARDYFTEIEIRISGDLTLSTSMDYEIFENNSLDDEVHLQGILGADWRFSELISLRCNFQFDQIDDYNFTPGDDRSFSTISAGMTFHW